MKKIIILNIAAMFVATVAFAAGQTDQTTVDISSDNFASAGMKVTAKGGPATNAVDVGKLSTKVDLGWKTDPAGYAIYTQHQSGTKAYGTSFDSTSIYTTDVTPGKPVTITITTGSDSFSSWTTM